MPLPFPAPGKACSPPLTERMNRFSFLFDPKSCKQFTHRPEARRVLLLTRTSISRKMNCPHPLTLGAQKTWKLPEPGRRGKATGQKQSLAEEGCAKEQESHQCPWLWSAWVKSGFACWPQWIPWDSLRSGQHLCWQAGQSAPSTAEPVENRKPLSSSFPAPAHTKESTNVHQ